MNIKREIQVVINDQLAPGVYSYQLNTAALAKNIYIVNMISDEEIINRKLIVE